MFPLICFVPGTAINLLSNPKNVSATGISDYLTGSVMRVQKTARTKTAVIGGHRKLETA